MKTRAASHALPAARKRFGQHFLHDQNVIARILDVLAPQTDDRVVEIGPGHGALTFPLLQRLRHLHAVEIDRDLVPLLRARARAAGDNLTVHETDVLKLSLTQLNLAAPLRVIGNLPYNISTPLIFHLLQQTAVISDMTFMLQREVAERLAALPGGKTYGRLSVMVQQRCRVRVLFHVAAGAFTPPPQVESSIVQLQPLAGADLVPVSAQFPQLVVQAFSTRRKTLRNCLRGVLTAADFADCGVDAGLRAEDLSVADFARLSLRLNQVKN